MPLFKKKPKPEQVARVDIDESETHAGSEITLDLPKKGATYNVKGKQDKRKA